jgi:hypothetical protein
VETSNLELNYKTPIVASDGNSIFIAEQGPATLVFFQVRGQDGQTVKADVVSAVRFHNLQELKQLQKSIEETIKRHESREK